MYNFPIHYTFLFTIPCLDFFLLIFSCSEHSLKKSWFVTSQILKSKSVFKNVWLKILYRLSRVQPNSWASQVMVRPSAVNTSLMRWPRWKPFGNVELSLYVILRCVACACKSVFGKTGNPIGHENVDLNNYPRLRP